MKMPVYGFADTGSWLKYAMALDNGEILPESEVICEYLEERFPNPALLPDGAEERARVRLLTRISDLYLLGPVFALIPHLDPTQRNQAVVDSQLELLTKGLDSLQQFIDDGGKYAVAGQMSLADCALVPAFFFLTGMMTNSFGAEIFKGRPSVELWWQGIGQNEHAARILAEMAADLKQRMAADN